MEHLEKLDEDGDNKISAIELSEHIFSAVLRMKIGAEIVGLEKIKNEVKRIKNRIIIMTIYNIINICLRKPIL